VPVRIHIDEVPEGVNLVAGLTATVQVEPYKASSAPGPAPATGKLSQPKPDASGTLVADEATPQPAPVQTMSPATANAAPSQAGGRAPPQPAQPQAAAQASPQASPPESATGPAAPVRGLGELDVSAPPSAEASNAAAAASADLKKLGEQIAANPPSGAASPPAAAKGGSDPSSDVMAQSQYLGPTIDLYDGQSVEPEAALRSPESLHRRARPRWRHGYGHQ
jgi:hypothetical protein